MKINQLFYWLTLSCTVLLAGCDGGDSDSDSGGPVEPAALELTFSEPPAFAALEGVQFADNVQYGEHPQQRFDFYKPASDTPTGLMLYFHGGGYTSGSEDYVAGLGAVNQALLGQGYAIISATYRFVDATHLEGVRRSLLDSKYALQFIRYHAETLNIDPDNIVLAGASAGASTSLWIGLQDDMADADAADLVLRESTRVKAIAALHTQATLDIPRWQSDVLAEFNLTNEQVQSLGGGAPRGLMFYGIPPTWENLDKPFIAWEMPEIIEYRQSVDMLDFFSQDDPELFVDNPSVVTKPADTNQFLHHAYHGQSLRLAAENAVVPGKFYYGPANNRLYASQPVENVGQFLLRKLAE